MLQRIQSFLEKSHLKYLVFWVLIFVFSISNASYLYASNEELLTIYAIRVSFQIVIAITIIEVLIPRILNKGKQWLFWFSVVLFLLIIYVICTAILKYYLEVKFPGSYVNYLKKFSDLTWYGRVTNLSDIISKSLYFLYPTFLILVLKLYQEKQNLLKLNEQKTTAELTALKNQLNPHFLFNTLNNLYALALKKSDDTTKVIQKLSYILDYILYGCNEKFVSLDKEIDLLENYLSLEKIRYGDRVKITFHKDVTGKEKIAPLILLTFLENAFKHGVAQEINQASIEIKISKKNEQIVYTIQNSKPLGVEHNASKDSIGLKNVKKQLELLYPQAYDLIIENTSNTFSANLKLDIV